MMEYTRVLVLTQYRILRTDTLPPPHRRILILPEIHISDTELYDRQFLIIIISVMMMRWMWVL